MPCCASLTAIFSVLVHVKSEVVREKKDAPCCVLSLMIRRAFQAVSAGRAGATKTAFCHKSQLARVALTAVILGGPRTAVLSYKSNTIQSYVTLYSVPRVSSPSTNTV